MLRRLFCCHYYSIKIKMGPSGDISKACGSREPQKRSRYKREKGVPSTRIAKEKLYLRKGVFKCRAQERQN